MIHKFKVLTFENYDGDSFDLSLDLGFELLLHKQCRLLGADTPELRGGTSASKAAGLVARDHVADWCLRGMKEGELFFASETYTGKFGRPLGDMVRIMEGEEESLRAYLLTHHLAVPYDGQAKSEIASAHKINLDVLLERGELDGYLNRA